MIHLLSSPAAQIPSIAYPNSITTYTFVTSRTSIYFFISFIAYPVTWGCLCNSTVPICSAAFLVLNLPTKTR